MTALLLSILSAISVGSQGNERSLISGVEFVDSDVRDGQLSMYVVVDSAWSNSLTSNDEVQVRLTSRDFGSISARGRFKDLIRVWDSGGEQKPTSTLLIGIDASEETLSRLFRPNSDVLLDITITTKDATMVLEGESVVATSRKLEPHRDATSFGTGLAVLIGVAGAIAIAGVLWLLFRRRSIQRELGAK